MPKPGLLAQLLAGDTSIEKFQQQIRLMEPKLHAWVQLKLEEHAIDGPLHGVPYGAKDIIETAGYLTTYGSPLYADHISNEDAALIQLLRSKGARLMGKTQTTSFAYFDPAPTRNPRNLEHSPGGSSSGSAAAVASGMVPFAIGTQTQGSIIRPASFCGVVGFKPTFDALPTAGIMPFAPTLDTAGFFTSNALDMRTLWSSLGFAIDAEPPAEYGMIEFDVEEPMYETFLATIRALGQMGCRIRRIPLPPNWEALKQAVPLVQTVEGARSMRERYEQHGNKIGLKLAQLVRDGLATADEQYQQALQVIAMAKQEMGELFQTFPVILSAAAPGPAPHGLSFTGNPRCNAVWTGLHTPAISIPMPVGDQLPMGLQMAAAPGQDALLLAAAAHCQALLNSGV